MLSSLLLYSEGPTTGTIILGLIIFAVIVVGCIWYAHMYFKEEMVKINRLRRDGKLTDEEFSSKKNDIRVKSILGCIFGIVAASLLAYFAFLLLVFLFLLVTFKNAK